MLRIRQTPILRRHEGSLLLIEGGWTALVPEIKAETAAWDAYRDYFIRRGEDPKTAALKATAAVQQKFTKAFLEGVRRCVGYWAIKYVERWPELAQDGFYQWKKVKRVVGFKPEIVQYWYVPGQKTGRDGLPFSDEALMEMAQAANGGD